jgi:hypothetical protein
VHAQESQESITMSPTPSQSGLENSASFSDAAVVVDGASLTPASSVDSEAGQPPKLAAPPSSPVVLLETSTTRTTESSSHDDGENDNDRTHETKESIETTFLAICDELSSI